MVQDPPEIKVSRECILDEELFSGSISVHKEQQSVLNLIDGYCNHFLFKRDVLELFVAWYLKKIQKFKLYETFRVKCEPLC